MSLPEPLPRDAGPPTHDRVDVRATSTKESRRGGRDGFEFVLEWEWKAACTRSPVNSALPRAARAGWRFRVR
jgi:hypothetical protein